MTQYFREHADWLMCVILVDWPFGSFDGRHAIQSVDAEELPSPLRSCPKECEMSLMLPFVTKQAKDSSRRAVFEGGMTLVL
jgi:hypothetical protein